jgi:hypothetical protein
VALEAVIGEDRANVAGKIDLFGSRCVVGEYRKRDDTSDQQRNTAYRTEE